ncbi:ADP-ribosylglycohydrolase family protein [Arthrobacter sp. Soil782]|uniref:ADP-ribosylglycohydrolase family protein n=1 Tax=Arthrobacter sp. Soil782 TaxID=1736410 RepID=UPI000AA919FE|nr:ADP-ribosylglycohydrolase family protein [Arthrobacter sp. Soil782]
MTSSECFPPPLRSRITGSILACALGEAAAGSPDASVFGDATALTLYTVDGMTEALEWANDGVAADETACLWLAYLRWLGTQGEAPPSSAPAPPARWIDRQDVLHTRRHSDAASIRALRSGEMGSRQRPLETDDDGPGALQRSAPFGLIANVPPAMVEKLTLDAAAITHGNPAARIPAALFAGLIHAIAHRELSLSDAVADAAAHAAALGSTDLSVQLTSPDAGALPTASPTAGNILCEALRLVLATATDDDAAHVSAFLAAAAEQDAPAARVTGAVAGAIIGALHGRDALPAAAIDQLTGARAVEELAGRFASEMGA